MRMGIKEEEREELEMEIGRERKEERTFRATKRGGFLVIREGGWWWVNDGSDDDDDEVNWCEGGRQEGVGNDLARAQVQLRVYYL